MCRLLCGLILCLAAGLFPRNPHAQPAPHAMVLDAASGRLLGSATLPGGTRVLTNRHVVDPALRRQAGFLVEHDGRRLAARLVAISDRLDLAVLVADGALALPQPRRAGVLLPGTAVRAWAPGGARVDGAAIAFAWQAAWGPAAFARMPVGFGFSGGPVQDAEGRLAGLIVAAVNPTQRQMTALRWSPGSAMPPDPPPVVMLLPIEAVLAEAARIDPGFLLAAGQ